MVDDDYIKVHNGSTVNNNGYIVMVNDGKIWLLMVGSWKQLMISGYRPPDWLMPPTWKYATTAGLSPMPA